MVIHPSPLSPPRPGEQLPPLPLLSRDNSSNPRSSSNRWRQPMCQRRCSILSVALMGCSSPSTATSMLSRRLSALQDRSLKIVSFVRYVCVVISTWVFIQDCQWLVFQGWGLKSPILWCMYVYFRNSGEFAWKEHNCMMIVK